MLILSLTKNDKHSSTKSPIIKVDIKLPKTILWEPYNMFFFKKKKHKNHILLLESQIALLEVLETPELGVKNGK